MDPNELTPLAGLVELTTAAPTQAGLIVSNGIDTWAVIFPEERTEHTLPVLGLKPNNTYEVQVVLTDQDGGRTVLGPLMAATEPLPDDFPEISVMVANAAKMEPGFILAGRFGRERNADPTLLSYTIAFDSAGEVVWYSSQGTGDMRQLSNGNLWWRTGNRVLETDMLGEIVNTTVLEDPGLGLHHDTFPTEHGTILSISRESVVVDDFPTSYTDENAPTATVTVLDEPIVEFALDGSLVNKWLLTEMLDPTRIGYGSLGEPPDGFDWAHANAVVHDPRDDSVIVSVRHQDAVVKFSRSTGNLIWILGPHNNWSGEFQQYLLDPVGFPFAWQHHQHAPMITPSGNILLFDNGNFRASPFDGMTPIPDAENCSRAVEYQIDEVQMEVRQVWEYGCNAEQRLYSSFISDADWMKETGNVLIDFGGIRFRVNPIPS